MLSQILDIFLKERMKQFLMQNGSFLGLTVVLNYQGDLFQRCEEMERMDQELNELTNERNALLGQSTSLEGQLAELKEENR